MKEALTEAIIQLPELTDRTFWYLNDSDKDDIQVEVVGQTIHLGDWQQGWSISPEDAIKIAAMLIAAVSKTDFKEGYKIDHP